MNCQLAALSGLPRGSGAPGAHRDTSSACTRGTSRMDSSSATAKMSDIAASLALFAARLCAAIDDSAASALTPVDTHARRETAAARAACCATLRSAVRSPSGRRGSRPGGMSSSASSPANTLSGAASIHVMNTHNARSPRAREAARVDILSAKGCSERGKEGKNGVKLTRTLQPLAVRRSSSACPPLTREDTNAFVATTLLRAHAWRACLMLFAVLRSV